MRLPDTGERFSWEKAAMHVHNVISGDLWIDMVGTQRIVAHTTGETASFKLHRASTRERRGTVTGEIRDQDGAKFATVAGRAVGDVYVTPEPGYVGSETLDPRYRGQRVTRFSPGAAWRRMRCSSTGSPNSPCPSTSSPASSSGTFPRRTPGSGPTLGRSRTATGTGRTSARL